MRKWIFILVLSSLAYQESKSMSLGELDENVLNRPSYVSRVLKMEETREDILTPLTRPSFIHRSLTNLNKNLQQFWPLFTMMGFTFIFPHTIADFMSECLTRVAAENVPSHVETANVCRDLENWGNTLNLEESTLWTLYRDVIDALHREG